MKMLTGVHHQRTKHGVAWICLLRFVLFSIYIYIYLCFLSFHSHSYGYISLCPQHQLVQVSRMDGAIHSLSQQPNEPAASLSDLEIWSGNWTSKTVLLWLTHKTQYLNCNNVKNIIIFVGRLELVRLFIFRIDRSIASSFVFRLALSSSIRSDV